MEQIRTVRRFVAYFHFVGWDCFSLGFHVCFGSPNIEIHLPIGFIRIGWKKTYPDLRRVEVIDDINFRRTYGLGWDY